jgi:soluble lytic murein transglycosylase-like protein
MPDAVLIAATKQIAKAQNLDPALVCAVCEQESNWQTYSIRYEPLFFSHYVAPLYTNNKITASEAYARAFSWGLMQVMGQVAREMGYSGPLAQLCDPTVGVLIGCKVLSTKLARMGGDVTAALLAWNGGGNPAYAGQVQARVVKYQ